MKTSIALIWKEWREVRWSLFAWSLIFIGFPLIVAFFNYLQGQNFYSPMGCRADA